jgi:lipoteichoic acid synthase
VAFRNHNFVTPRYTVIGNTVYLNRTGKVIHPNASLKQELATKQDQVNEELSLSDTVASKNLLRFYVPKGFTPVDPQQTNFANSLTDVLQTQKTLGNKSTSLYSENGNKTTVGDFHTDAPEVQSDPSILTKFPKSVLKNSSSSSSSSESSSSTKNLEQ